MQDTPYFPPPDNAPWASVEPEAAGFDRLQLASVIAGGPAPLIATALFAAYGTGYAIAIYLARGDQPDLDGVHARLHQKRRFRRIRRLSLEGLPGAIVGRHGKETTVYHGNEPPRVHHGTRRRGR